MRSQTDKAIAFRALHQRPGAFIIPNPWDAGTAKLLAALGFEALATTSLGLANMLGRDDSVVTRAEVIENCRVIAAATDLPVNADLENCFAHAPEAAAVTIGLAAEAGAVGGSIEDYTGDRANPIYDFDLRWSGCARRPRSPIRCRCRSCSPRGRRTCCMVRMTSPRPSAGYRPMRRPRGRVVAPGLRNTGRVRHVVSALKRPFNVVTGWLDPDITRHSWPTLGRSGSAWAARSRGSRWRRSSAPDVRCWRKVVRMDAGHDADGRGTADVRGGDGQRT